MKVVSCLMIVILVVKLRIISSFVVKLRKENVLKKDHVRYIKYRSKSLDSISKDDVLIQDSKINYESKDDNLEEEPENLGNRSEDDSLIKDRTIVSRIMMGIEPTPEIIGIMTIYFVEGAISLAGLARTFLLKDTFNLGPAEMSALSGLFTFPWILKPIYGFLSDGFPLFGYRRRSYLVLVGLLGCVSFALLGIENIDGIADDVMLKGSVVSILLSSACIAFADVVADGIVVERTRDSNDQDIAGGLQSLCWGSASVGGLLSAYFSGSLLEIMTPREVFRICAILPLLVAAIAFSMEEKPSSTLTKYQVSDQMQALLQALKNPAVWKPTLFLFLWQSTPTSEGAFLYFMTNELGMGPEFLGRVRLLTSVAALVGVWGYQKYLRKIPIRDILLWTTIASAPFGLLNLILISHYNQVLGIPDGAFIFGDDIVLVILGQLAFLPTLVLAAQICPPGVEAVLFATLMSVYNGASTVGTEIGAALTKLLGVTESNFDNLGLLTIICNLSSLVPLLLIGLLNDFGQKTVSEMEDE